MLHHISQQHPDIDYVLLTGDNTPHDVHMATPDEVLLVNLAVSRLARQHLPRVLMLPVLGNHDVYPLNSVPSPETGVPRRFSNDWLLKPLAKEWRYLLDAPVPGENGIFDGFNSTFPKRAFYYVRIKSLGLRFLVINTNLCYRLNFWTLLAIRDPAGQLRWLVQQLQLAEQLSEHVHIVGHISPGDPDCRFDWSREYNRIVHRFSDTIKAQFFSHTHLDEFQLAINSRGRPVSTAYIGPSLTTWTNINPGYRIYSVDRSTGEVTDFERWGINLDEANKSPDREPFWYRLYSAREAYGMSSLSPESWLGLVRNLTSSRKEFDRLYYNYWGGSAQRTRCNLQCRKRVICNILTFDRSNLSYCP